MEKDNEHYDQSHITNCHPIYFDKFRYTFSVCSLIIYESLKFNRGVFETLLNI